MEDPLKRTFSRLPGHIAIIMDGNGRWAKSRGLPRIEGHQQGVANVETILECASRIDLKVITLFAFSSENWNRPREEVDALMKLLSEFLKSKEPLLHKHKVRLFTIGRKMELPQSVVEQLNRVEESTAHYPRTLGLALNYGSRIEVVDALKGLIYEVNEQGLNPESIDWDCISKHLYTRDLPDPDLIIRTSGESRLSNFLLLQSAYAEIYYTPLNWPEFGPQAFADALAFYETRERRYGRTSDQVTANDTVEPSLPAQS